MHPLTALDRCGGVARWSTLAGMSVGRGPLVELAAQGLIARPARGVFCRPELAGDLTVRAICVSGQLTCLGGAEALGLELLQPTMECHVRTPPNPRAPRARSGALLHPWGVAGAGPVAPLMAVLHDCAACLPLPDAVVVLDSALRLGQATESDWPEVLAAGPHAGRVRMALALTDPKAGSVLESVARTLLATSGVRDLVSQVYIEDVGWVDLVIAGWLVIELDGWEFHRQKFQDDRRRDAELTRQGFVVLRFTYGDLMNRRSWVLDVVRDALARGRPPFGAVIRRPA